MAAATRDKLRRAQERLSHRLPSGDVSEIFDRALDALHLQLDEEENAATEPPRAAQAASANPRHIPAAVKRAVRERDGSRCTDVSEDGRRCESRRFLEWDHVIPVARGGESTVANVRQRCSAHNALEAERAFGAGFMHAKRRQEREVEDPEARQQRLDDAHSAAAVEALSDEARACAITQARAAAEQAGARALALRQAEVESRS